MTFRSASVAAALIALPRLAVAGVCDGISPASSSPMTTVVVASGLLRPLFVASPPNDVARQFIVLQDGKIVILKDGQLLATPFLDIGAAVYSPADGAYTEQGLLGLAFHPNYAQNGWFFVYYTDPSGSNELWRYTVSATNPDQANPASGQRVMTFDHPNYANHDGGMLAFGPSDGMLYIGTGDGGGSCDPSGNAQNGGAWLGKLLRIDVDQLPYTVPPDNPFVGNGAYRPEVWAVGVRNPWRWSFDRSTGDLYIGDVGQDNYEEIDWRPPHDVGGANYGWNRYEGLHCPNPSCGSTGSCTIPSYVAPILEYPHASGACSITGGYAYRGCRMPDLAGTYFYADYCAAFVKTFVVSGGAPANQRDVTAQLQPGGGVTITSPTSFGEDARGELFITSGDGHVFKVVPILPNLEVSGPGATEFLLSKGGPWTWEDLHATSSQAISEYHVLRAPGSGSGTFACIARNATTSWAGDATRPAVGAAFSYLVVGVNTRGQQTSPGTRTGGRARNVSTATCP